MRPFFAVDPVRSGSLAACLLAVFLSSHTVGAAAEVTWDIVTGDAAVSGGEGVWNLALANWTKDDGVTNILWSNTNNDTAVFGETAGTITLATGITVGGVTFNDYAGFLLTGNTLTFGSAGAITTHADAGISSVIAGAGSAAITLAGPATLMLAGANTFGGQLTVEEGTLKVATLNNASSNGVLGNSANAVILGKTGDFTGTLEYTGSSTSNNKKFTLASGGRGAFMVDGYSCVLTLGGGIDGGGALIKSGAGTLSLTATNTYGGGTTVNEGTLVVSGSLGGALTVAGLTAIFDLAGTSQSLGTVSLQSGAQIIGASGTLTATSFSVEHGSISAKLAGATAALTKTGGGTVVLTGSNSYGGATVVNEGTLHVTTLASLPGLTAPGRITVGALATLRVNAGGSGEFDAGNLDSLLGNAVFAATSTLGIDTTRAVAGAFTYGTTLGGGLGLDKSGVGTLTLSGANTYLGGTTVSAGTLALAGTGTLGAAGGALAVDGVTALVNLGTSSQTVGVVSLINGARINNGTLIATAFNVDNGSINARLAGAAAVLTKDTPGTVTLSGANTYGGGTRLKAGVLSLGGSGALGASGTLHLLGGTLQFSASNTDDYSDRFSKDGGQIYDFDTNGQTVTLATALTSSGGALIKTGAGTLILSGANTYNGGTTVNAGTLWVAGAGTLGASGGMLVVDGATAIVNLGGTNQIAGSVTVSGGGQILSGSLTGGSFTVEKGSIGANLAGNGVALTKATGGTVTLSGNNSYSGGTNIDGDVLALGSSGALGTLGTLSFGGGTLQFSASNTTDYSARFSPADGQAYHLDTNGQAVTLASALTSAGGVLTKYGAGTLTLTAHNTYDGGTLVNAGTLALAGAGTLGAGTGTLDVNGATAILDLGSTFQTVDAVSLLNGAQIIGSGTLNGTFVYVESGSISANLTGAGTMLTKDKTGSVTLSGTNTCGGGTHLAAGVLVLGSSGALGTSGAITFAGGTLRFSSNNTTDYSARFSTADAQAFNIDTNGQAVTLASALTSSGGILTKTGAGTLTLGGSNNYDGGTYLNVGVVALASSGALGGSGLIHFTGGTLQFSANNTNDYSARFSTVSNQTCRLDTNGQTVTLASPLTSGALAKSGAGTLLLAGASTYGGATSVTAGMLKAGVASVANASGAFGNNSAVTLANSAGVSLDITGFNTQLGSLAGGGAAGGNVTLGAATLSVGGDGTSTGYAGTISGTGGLVKLGGGAWTLSGANGFSGGVMLSLGQLNINHAQALGVAPGVFTVGGAVGGAVLDNTSSGPLTNSNNNPQSWTGNFSFTGTQDLNLGTGAVSLGASRTVTVNAGTLSVGGPISQTGGGFTLTKAGAGTLVLSGNLGYTGATSVSAGKLVLGGNNAAATGGINVTGGAVQFDAVAAINGSARNVTITSPGALVFGALFGTENDIATALANRINATSGAIGADNYGGTHFNFNTADLATASFGAIGNVTYTGTLTPNGTTYRLGGGGGTLVFTPATHNSTYNLIINGNGNLGTVDFGGLSQAFGAITFAGGTTRNGILTGTSFTGSGGTVSASLAGSAPFTSTGNPMTLNGNNSGYSGTITVSSGVLQAVDPRSLGTGTITFSGGGTLSLANDGSGTGLGNGKRESFNYGTGVTLTTSQTISVGQYTAAGSSTLFNAQNKTLQLGALNIGNQTLTVGNNNGFGLEFTGTTSFTAATPVFNVGGDSNATVVAGLTLSGKVTGAFGFTKSGGGALVLSNTGNDFGSASTLNITGGMLRVSSDAALGVSNNIISINGGGLQADATFTTARRINTTAGTCVIDVTQGGVAGGLNMLTLGSAFNNGAASANNLTKSGNGILEVNADNNGATPYTGIITVSAGALRVSNAGALGSSGTGNTIVSGNALVSGGAAVQLNGVSTAEKFDISNTGLNGGGAIQNLSGNNTLSGAITLSNNASIGADAGTTLNLNSAINGSAAGKQLTFAGAGAINVPLAIGSNISSLTKLGSGTTTLSGFNAYTSGTTINGGTLVFSGAAGQLRLSPGPVVVNMGGALTLDNATNLDNRLHGAYLTLSGGTLHFIANSLTTEAIGIFTPNAGLNTLSLSGTGGTLSFESLGTRASGAVVNFTGSGPGVQFVAATTVANGLLVGSSSAAAFFFGGSDFASSSGTADAPITAFAGYVTGDLSGAGYYDTVKPTGAQSNVNTMTVNALNLTAGTGVAINPGQTLTLGAGGLINNGGGNIAGGWLTTADNTELIANYLSAGSISSIIAGTSGGLTKVGAGNLTLANRMTYTGKTTVNQGTLTLVGNHLLAVDGALEVNLGGTLDLGGFSQHVQVLRSAGSTEGTGGIITGTGGTLTVNQATTNVFAGSIQGALNLLKSGDGTLTLTSMNPTSGTLAVIGGIGSVRERDGQFADLGEGLTLRDGGALPNVTAITVRGATLNLDNSGFAGNKGGGELAADLAVAPWSTKDLANRLSDAAPITLDNATIRYVGRGQTNSTELLGPVSVTGFSSITMISGGTPQGSGGISSATLTLASLTLSPGSMLQFNRSAGTNTPLGQIGNEPRVLIAGDDTSGLTFCNGIVVGMASCNDNHSLRPVSYVPGLGFGSLGTPGFPNTWTSAGSFATAGPTDNVMMSGSQVVRAGGQTINSLGIQGSGFGASSTPLTFQNPNDTLTIASGWLGMWFQQTAIGDKINRGALTSGQNTLYMLGGYVVNWGDDGNVNTIHSVIKDNGVNPVMFSMNVGRHTYLTANNTYTGGTVVNGELALDYGEQFRNFLWLDGDPGAVVIPNAANPATGLVISGANVTMLKNQGQIGSNNVVTLNGGSTLELVGNNTLAGLVFNSNAGTVTPAVFPVGILTLTGDISSTPTNPEVTPVIDGGMLDFAGAARSLTVGALPGGDYADFAGLAITSVIQNGGLTKNGAGTLVLTGANTFSGTTTLNAGTLSVAADANLGNANPLVFNGGTLQITGTTLTSYAAGFIGTHAVTLTTGKSVGLDIHDAANTFNVSQVLNQGSGGLTKDGAGTLVLTSANTYSGATTIKAGTLRLDGGGSLANSTSLIVGDTGSFGAVLDVTTKAGGFTVGSGQTLGGNGTVIGATTIQGIQTPGNSTGILTFSNSLTYAATAHLQWQLTANTNSGRGSNFDGVDVTSGTFSIVNGAIIDLSFGASVNFLDSFWGADRSWLVVDLGNGLTGDGGTGVFTLGTLSGGNPTGTFAVTRVADANGKKDVMLNWTAPLGNPYDLWIAARGLTGNAALPTADPDHDGVPNSLEFVLGGEPNPANPGSDSRSLLPVISRNAGGDLLFSFHRKNLSESTAVLTFQWATDLAFPSANNVPVGAVSSATGGVDVTVSEGTPDAGTDAIVITVPAGKAAGGRLFGRLGAAVTSNLVPVGSAYDLWIAATGLSGASALPYADPDHDGLPNALEFVLGGEPNPANAGSNSSTLLPTVVQSGGNLVFTFRRKDLSEGASTLTFQWSTDLSFPPANDVPVGAVSSSTNGIDVGVNENTPDADTDTIIISVPVAKAAGGRLFGRLAVTVP